MQNGAGHEHFVPESWDYEADVVVVGFGAAGVAAAVTAHDQGDEVLILEKAPEGQEGGNTRVAGQGYLNTSSAESAAAYLTALCGAYTVPEKMIRVWAEEMCRNNEWLSSVGGDPQEHQHPPEGIEFPFGFLNFRVIDLVPGSAVDVAVHLPEG